MTDFHRIVIYFAVVAATFLAAMAWGWQNLWLLLASIGVLLAAVLSVVVVVNRRGAVGHEIATAKVLSASAPPDNVGIAARCDMRLEVLLPGRPPVRTRHRDPAVPLTRWPQPGQTFPVDVLGRNPRRHMRIRWDLVEQGLVRAPDNARPSSGARASQAPMWEEENEPIIFSPTPPRPRRPHGSAPPPPPAAPPPASPSPAAPSPTPPPASSSDPPGTETALYLHETFTDIDEDSPGPPPSRHAPRAGGNGHDPYGIDPADFETPRLTPASPPAASGGPAFETLALSDFDPAEVDIRDFTGEPPAVTVTPAEDDESTPPPAATPRDQTPSASPSTGDAPPAIPLPRDPDSVSENRDE